MCALVCTFMHAHMNDYACACACVLVCVSLCVCVAPGGHFTSGAHSRNA